MTETYVDVIYPCKNCEGLTKPILCESCPHYQDTVDTGYDNMVEEANKHLIKALEILRDIKLEESEIEVFFLEFLEEN